MRRKLTVLLVLVLVGTACGGEDEADQLAEAIGERMWVEAQSSAADEGLTAVPFFTEDDSLCMGQMFVDVVGYETLTDAGVTVERVEEDDFDLGGVAPWLDDREKIDAFFEGINDCIDFAGPMAAEFADQMGVSQESAACFLEGISTSEAMRSAMASEMLGDEVADPLEDPESIGAMFDMMNDCFTNEELGRILGAGFQP